MDRDLCYLKLLDRPSRVGSRTDECMLIYLVRLMIIIALGIRHHFTIDRTL